MYSFNKIFAVLSVALLCLTTSTAKAQESFVTLEQGWSVSDMQRAFHGNLGTQLMPARWFFALENADSTQNFSQSLEKFGFINTASGIPIGVTFDESEVTAGLYKEKKWVGVNCALCHTSALEINGTTVLFNGNQPRLRLQEFEEAIVKNVEATLLDPAKMDRFAKNLSEINIASLSKRLNLFRNEFKIWNQRNHHYFDKQNREVRWGPGRVDGVGGSTNDLTCALTPRMGTSPILDAIFVSSKNCGPSHAPVSIPHLWGMTNQDLVQWNGEVHASLGRNVGALMSGFGKNWVEHSWIGTPKVMTTVKIGEIYKVEELYKKLKTPAWEDMVDHKLADELDLIKVAKGKELFNQNCQNCHAVQPKLTEANKFGNRYWDFPIISIKQIGTDPFYTTDELQRKTFVSPIIAPIFLAMFGFSDIELNGRVPAYVARGILPGAAIANYFVENSISQASIDTMNNCRGDKKPPRLDGIKAKSLEGILFTAPYLHNGSVPTIYDLLEKPANRPAKFVVGCRKYSLETFGFDCSPSDAGSFEYDTSRQGNGNQGHDYGTALSMSEKAELVEFIKSLQQPAYTPGNANCN